MVSRRCSGCSLAALTPHWHPSPSLQSCREQLHLKPRDMAAATGACTEARAEQRVTCGAQFPFLFPTTLGGQPAASLGAQASESSGSRVDVAVQAVEADNTDGTWTESVNTNNCYELAPPGFTFEDYIADTDMVAWPLFGQALACTVDPPGQLPAEDADHFECFWGPVEPQAGIYPIPLQYAKWLVQGAQSGVLTRRAPRHMSDELESVTSWLHSRMQDFLADCGGKAGQRALFARTAACSPKDGVPPGAGPYHATAADAARLCEAMVTSSRVTSAMRRFTRSKPSTAREAFLSGGEGAGPQLPHHVYHQAPLHARFPGHCKGLYPLSSPTLILQEWSPLIRPECEFRCFVRDGHVTAVSQNTWFTPFTWLRCLSGPRKVALARAVAAFQRSWLRPRLDHVSFALDSYVMDVVVLPVKEGRLLDTHQSISSCDPDVFAVRLLELNSFGAHLSSGSALFAWQADLPELYGMSVREGEKSPRDSHTLTFRWLRSLKRAPGRSREAQSAEASDSHSEDIHAVASGQHTSPHEVAASGSEE